MRRSAPALLLVVALLGAGCQTGFDEGKENAKPLKVAHALGESKVPGEAERPLALSPGALDTALALGLPIVGAALPGRPGARLPRAERGDRAREAPLAIKPRFGEGVQAGRDRGLPRRISAARCTTACA